MRKKRVKATVTIRVPLTPGRCRWCRCTHETPCANGCGWADRTQTLCTECVPLDTAMETAKGRQALTEFLQDQSWEPLENMPRSKASPASKHRARG